MDLSLECLWCSRISASHSMSLRKFSIIYTLAFDFRFVCRGRASYLKCRSSSTTLLIFKPFRIDGTNSSPDPSSLFSLGFSDRDGNGDGCGCGGIFPI